MWLKHPVVFVADRVQPRLGMVRALESLLDLLPADRIELVVIAGPAPDEVRYPVTALNQPPGWRGRLLSIRQLRGLAKSRADAGAVIVAVGSWAFIPLALSTMFSKYKLTLWEHSLLPWRIRHEWRVTAAALALRVLSFRLNQAICVSPSNRAVVSRLLWPLTQVAVIPNVIEMKTEGKPLPAHESEAETDGREEIRLLGVGALTPGKNWDLAVRAMSLLPPRFTLALAGDGKQCTQLTTLIEELNMHDRVRLLGYVPHGDNLMASADIIVHPSFAETFGYTMIEAAARHRPVIVLDMPVMNEVVPGLACGEVAGGDPQEFADAILRAAGAKYDYSGAEAARKEHFSSESVVESWLTLIARQGL